MLKPRKTIDEYIIKENQNELSKVSDEDLIHQTLKGGGALVRLNGMTKNS